VSLYSTQKITLQKYNEVKLICCALSYMETQIYMFGTFLCTRLIGISSYPVQVQDAFPFSIGFSSDGAQISTGSNCILFPKGQPFPSTKVLTFQRSNLLHLEAFYANLNELPAGVSTNMSSFTVSLLEFV